jgi:hypothetical protein
MKQIEFNVIFYSKQKSLFLQSQNKQNNFLAKTRLKSRYVVGLLDDMEMKIFVN